MKRKEGQEKLENSASRSSGEKAGTETVRGWGKRREYLSFKVLGEFASSFPQPNYLWVKVDEAKVEPDLISGIGKQGIHQTGHLLGIRLIKITNRAPGWKFRMDKQEKHILRSSLCPSRELTQLGRKLTGYSQIFEDGRRMDSVFSSQQGNWQLYILSRKKMFLPHP